jgi:hypothetical protein
MAARRLLIVMVVLLVISSLAAALVPPPEERTTSSSTTGSSPSTQPVPDPAQGERVTHRIDVSSKAPRKLELSVGDQLSLTVTSTRFAEIAIPALGLIDTATQGSPARFDILIDEPGTFAIRRLEPPRELAKVMATPNPSARSGER